MLLLRLRGRRLRLLLRQLLLRPHVFGGTNAVCVDFHRPTGRSRYLILPGVRRREDRVGRVAWLQVLRRRVAILIETLLLLLSHLLLAPLGLEGFLQVEQNVDHRL